ncbi:hypothetical protein [Mycobacterium uberis]|uniref:hypothetical protein n=1 Tax=Mycobacterium uberis TaxID=2162698 RepID=UPI001FB50C88|nr:hypothetical protein [Mycobacterium uberis]
MDTFKAGAIRTLEVLVHHEVFGALSLPNFNGHPTGAMRVGREVKLSSALVGNLGGMDADGEQPTMIAARHNTAIAHANRHASTLCV